MSFSLCCKTALVTGAGRGIGRAIATRLAAAGAKVMVNDLDEAALCETEDILRKSGYKIDHAIGDLTDPSTPDKLVQKTIETFGSLDIIVNNAGYSWDGVIQKTTDEQFLAMLEIHLMVPFRILRAASSYIRDTAKAEIAAGKTVMRKVVNITSIAGTDGNPGQAGYSSGKAGVIGLTKTLAKEWGRYNVNVNAVGFGLINTRLVQPLSASGGTQTWKCMGTISRSGYSRPCWNLSNTPARSVASAHQRKLRVQCCSSALHFQITSPGKC